MDAKLDRLRALGCNVDEAIDRFMGDKSLYFECFENLITDTNLDNLTDALSKNDCESTFHYAHMLKSVYANMGLTPLYDDCVVIVEAARAGCLSENLKENCSRMKAFMNSISKL